MLKNNLKTAFRYLWHHKVFSGINLIGLATGLCVCYFALLYVHFELSYDTFHEKGDRIYRLVTDVKTSTGISYESSTGAMGPAIQAAFPEVEKVTRIFLDYLIIQKDQHHFDEEKIAYADASLFSVFTFPLLSGDPKSVLNAPNTIVLSASAARKYFGTENPVGKTLIINGNNRAPAQVTGVMKDIPYHSHFRVDMLVSMATLGEGWMHNWKRFFFYTYLLLPENANPSRLSAQLTDFIQEHTDQSLGKFELSLEPLKSIYLHAKPRGSRTGSAASGNTHNVYIFSLVAAFVLIIASFNFINLTTAFSLQRAREIGVRKVLGASKKQLIFQFLMDAVLLSSVAMVLALLLCTLLLPFFNQLAGKIISTHIFEHLRYVGLLAWIAVAIGLLSGIYPAFFLSGFQPLRSLKGRFVSDAKGLALRKVLVVTQFSISIVLIIATLVVYTQLDYMQSHELGFKKEHQLVIDFQFDQRVTAREATIKQELSRIPGVDGISLSSCIPGRANHTYPTQIENINHEMQDFQVDAYFIDDEFLAQYQIEVIAGRGFSKHIASDVRSTLLINETAIKSLGYVHPQDAIGKRFWQLGIEGTIIGVIKDFHFHSFQEKVRPLTLRMASGFFTFMTLNVSSQNMQETISKLEDTWQELVPGMPFLYFFADEAYNAQYKTEQRFGKLFACLSTLAILISCLGLLGLSTFSTAQRVKEIGIRKVLGASVTGILVLLSKEYIKLTFLAFVIAIPVANYFATEWLNHFAYRTEVHWWIFALSGMLVLLVALLSVTGQTWKAAQTNPVDSLRNE